MFEKVVVIDCKGHMTGRVASVVAKELMNGQRVVLVRCEELNISGSLYRNKIIFERFMRLHVNTNPKRGPFHHRSPSRMMFRTIRGMIPHKTARGAAALKRLKTYEGIPAPYDKQKRVCVPAAVRNTRLRPGRSFCRMGDVCELVGWTHNELMKRLEAKRLTNSAAYHNSKTEMNKLKEKAVEATKAELAETNKALAEFGY